jgi:integrase
LSFPAGCRAWAALTRGKTIIGTVATHSQSTVSAWLSAMPRASDAANVHRDFCRVIKAAGLDATAWTPRELRHSFVSLLSASGVDIETISHLVGHANTRVTELVYRKELRPVLTRGAAALDILFPADPTGPLVSSQVSTGGVIRYGERSGSCA